MGAWKVNVWAGVANGVRADISDRFAPESPLRGDVRRICRADIRGALAVVKRRYVRVRFCSAHDAHFLAACGATAAARVQRGANRELHAARRVGRSSGIVHELGFKYRENSGAADGRSGNADDLHRACACGIDEELVAVYSEGGY